MCARRHFLTLSHSVPYTARRGVSWTKRREGPIEHTGKFDPLTAAWVVITHFRDIQFVTIFVLICPKLTHSPRSEKVVVVSLRRASSAGSRRRCSLARPLIRVEPRGWTVGVLGAQRAGARDCPRVSLASEDVTRANRSARTRAEHWGLGYCWPAPVPRERHGTLRLPRDPRRGRGPRSACIPRRPPPVHRSPRVSRAARPSSGDPIPPPSRSLAAARIARG